MNPRWFYRCSSRLQHETSLQARKSPLQCTCAVPHCRLGPAQCSVCVPCLTAPHCRLGSAQSSARAPCLIAPHCRLDYACCSPHAPSTSKRLADSAQIEDFCMLWTAVIWLQTHSSLLLYKHTSLMTHTSKGFYYFLLTFLGLEQISCSLYWIVLEYFFNCHLSC